MSLTPEVVATLSRVSTGTITTVLLKKGLRNVWMRGTKPIRSGQPRLIGRAFTLRFVPARGGSVRIRPIMGRWKSSIVAGCASCYSREW